MQLYSAITQHKIRFTLTAEYPTGGILKKTLDLSSPLLVQIWREDRLSDPPERPNDVHVALKTNAVCMADVGCAPTDKIWCCDHLKQLRSYSLSGYESSELLSV